jgi:hypothetical protein
VLPDALPLRDDRGRALLLIEPTDSYAHGILGDALEATGVAILDRTGVLEQSWVLDDDSVFETLAPIWVDLNADGKREIVITRSSPESGAALQVFSEEGEVLARGPAIGTAYRWTHLLAVAPTGPSGETEILTVRTPHIGGVLEFYRLKGRRLELVHSRRGFSTHRIGSRNLDMAVVADLGGHEELEILLPTQDFNTLQLVRRRPEGSSLVWSHELPAALSTNLGVISDRGMLSIACGTSDGKLLIWD